MSIVSPVSWRRETHVLTRRQSPATVALLVQQLDFYELLSVQNNLETFSRLSALTKKRWLVLVPRE